MPTVAEEIAQLAELHRQGILSAHEFVQLKQATIGRHVASAQSAEGLPQPAPQPPHTSAVSHACAAATEEHRADSTVSRHTGSYTDCSRHSISTIDAVNHNSVSVNYTNTHDSLVDPGSPNHSHHHNNNSDDTHDSRACVAGESTMRDGLSVGEEDETEWAARALEQRFPRLRLRALLAAAAHTPTLAYETALRHLEQVVHNLLHHPDEPRYRRLRQGNRRLQSELLAVPGTREVLEDVGFVPATESAAIMPPPPHTLNARDSAAGDECVLVIPPHSRTPAPAMLQETLCALSHVRQRDVARRRRHAAVRRLRHDIVLDIRCEQARRARAEGVLLNWLVAEYTVDEAGDELATARRNAATLCEVLAQAVRHPRVAMFHRLRLRNAAVYRAFVRQRGGLEALLVLAGGELRGGRTGGSGEEETGECSRLVTADAVVNAEEECVVWLPMSSGSGDAEGAAETEEESPPLAGALAVARALCVALEEEQQRRVQARRLSAEQAMRVELRRARAAERLAVGGGAASSVVLQGRRRRDSSDSSDSDGSVLSGGSKRRRGVSSDSDNDTREGGEMNKPHRTRGGSGEGRATSGRRVPIAQALAILMGKRRPWYEEEERNRI